MIFDISLSVETLRFLFYPPKKTLIDILISSEMRGIALLINRASKTIEKERFWCAT